MSADGQQLKVSKADLPQDEASYPLFTEQPLPLARGHVLGKGALPTPRISQIHICFCHMLLAHWMSTHPLHSSTLKM